MELILVLLESGQGTSDDQAAHGVTDHGDFEVAFCFGNLGFHLACQPDSHSVDISLGSGLVGSGDVYFNFAMVIPFELDFEFFHI